ncbi:response regulator transcription factor [Deinococcus soli (ex Cha et al. 2016)]|uniref:DNA-binding response OmpR family regulator n=2 Tax=Deinococcus soli (ex Cha et al. 2016) TaxID=1309411 RepID=A0AAE3XEM5_9DEIO|nr:response regulator transcription factor [Deinococcus soli (ex Cha et al. 2016)]MDR6218725.1 DNA-binding response OmpR family regulator [Deinococcus soli (ex Cha et al. 2016)]MDR6328522.1 DNA-binding response OmpR family regulator [Deinococcus soli (ex Cha et al. 2016)]MDR6753133.1 DNA-binding response OmpR family regulator [Deinococcus soli (ex Cha et al. 2016)]
MNKTILVIEDNPDIMAVVTYALNDAGLNVLSAPTGASGLTQARDRHPDLVLLDLGLPDLDGSEVARRIKRSMVMPVIVLTALDDVSRKVNLLEIGADDYLTKPFDPDELLARINVQFRRYGKQDRVQTIGPLRIDAAARRVTWQGRQVRLSPREYQLLNLLAADPGRVFPRAQLEQQLGGAAQAGGGVMDVHLANLRAKLRAAGAVRALRTVRGVGYALHVTSGDPLGRAGVFSGG